MVIGFKAYKRCARCVMDTTDDKITFNSGGVCDHCQAYDALVASDNNPFVVRDEHLQKLLSNIKATQANREFDCILGLSGGLDSSYMLHLLVTKFNLRPLVFHVDAGWNTDTAVHNIQCLVEKLGLDLFTDVIDWEEMRQFQLAWFRSGLPMLDIPQDMAFVASMYRFAHSHGIKYIINGGNVATEFIRNPKQWIYFGTDPLLLNDVTRKFCDIKLKTFPISNIFWHKFYLKYIRGVKVIKPLNYIRYNKDSAERELSENYGWRPFRQKHFESRFTKFYEGYWLPERFGFDPRLPQLSSLILSGQIPREQALELLSRPALTADEIEVEWEFVAQKLGISLDELQKLFNDPRKTYKDYRNMELVFDFGSYLMQRFGGELSIKR